MPIRFKSSQTNKVAAAEKKSSSNRVNSKHSKDESGYDVIEGALFTSEELGEFKQVFEFFDINNAKTIDFKNLSKAFQSLGIHMNAEEMSALFSLLDVDGDKTLDFSEFCMVIDFIRGGHDKWREMRDAFGVLDSGGGGCIGAHEFGELMMRNCGDQISIKEIHAMIKFADKDNKGVIKYEELIDLMMEEDENRQRKAAPNKFNFTTNPLGYRSGSLKNL